MKQIEVLTFGEFQSALDEASGYMWRGMPDVSFELIPKVARDWHLESGSLEISERAMLEQFKVRAVPFLKSRPANDWEWLALGQHYGLPSRFLDWTLNPLIALYFACVGEMDCDGVVYFAGRANEVDPEKLKSPFDVDGPRAWHPFRTDQRISFQDGLFTIMPDPQDKWSNQLRLQIIIKKEAKEPFLKMLELFGVHSGSVFPGLEGVAKYVSNKYFHFRGMKDKDSIIKRLKAAISADDENFDDDVPD